MLFVDACVSCVCAWTHVIHTYVYNNDDQINKHSAGLTYGFMDNTPVDQVCMCVGV